LDGSLLSFSVDDDDDEDDFDFLAVGGCAERRLLRSSFWGAENADGLGFFFFFNFFVLPPLSAFRGLPPLPLPLPLLLLAELHRQLWYLVVECRFLGIHLSDAASGEEENESAEYEHNGLVAKNGLPWR